MVVIAAGRLGLLQLLTDIHWLGEFDEWLGLQVRRHILMMSLSHRARLLFSRGVELGSHVTFQRVSAPGVFFITSDLLLLDIWRLVCSLT